MSEQIKKNNLNVTENESTMEDETMNSEKETKVPFWKRAALACGCTLAVILSLRGCGAQQNSAAEINQADQIEAYADNLDNAGLNTQTAYVDRYVEVAPQSVTETVTEYVEVPGETKTEYVTNTVTEYVEVPGETKIVTVPGETVIKTVEVPVEVPVYVEKEVAHVYEVQNTINNGDGTYNVTFVCSECGDTYTLTIGDQVEAHQHNFAVVSHKDATCEENGYDVYACECGASYTEEIAAAGHQWTEWTVTTEATTESNAVETRTCNVCGETESREVEGSKIVVIPEEPEHEHNYVEVARVEATTDAEGYVEYACECGDSYREVIDKLPVIPEHEHSYVEVNRQDATCETDGFVEYACECGDSYVETIAATGHNYVADDSTYVAPTEDSEGKEADEVCTNCGDVHTGATIDKIEKVDDTDWKAATRVEFNEYGWGFYTNFNGEDICTTRGAYKQYLSENYSQLTVCEDDVAVWAE